MIESFGCTKFCYYYFMPTRFQKILEKTFKDKKGNVVIAQRPNTLIFVWLILSILSRINSLGGLKNGLALTASAALFAWAYQEITSGVNYFRKLLGIVVLAVIVIGYFTK